MERTIFQQAPFEMDEIRVQGFLFGGMAQYYSDEIASAFKLAGDTLVTEALASQEAWRLCHPILFNYRHSIELYLKLVLPESTAPHTHNLAKLLQMLNENCQARFKKSLPEWFKSLILEFDEFDAKSTAFRYDNQLSAKGVEVTDEHWIDLRQLSKAVDKLQDGFLWLLRNREDTKQ